VSHLTRQALLRQLLEKKKLVFAPMEASVPAPKEPRLAAMSMVPSVPLERLAMKPKLSVTVMEKHISAILELVFVMTILRHIAQLCWVERRPSSAKMEVSALAPKEHKWAAI